MIGNCKVLKNSKSDTFLTITKKLKKKMSKYALKEKDRKRLEDFVPKHQYRVQYSFRADVSVNKSKYNKCGVAISEHMIVLAKKGFFFGFNRLMSINILIIDYFEVPSTDQVTFGTGEANIVVHGDPEDISKFAHTFLKNYKMICGILPPNLKCQISIEDSLNWEDFNPHLSPSQMFQTLYNCCCSLYNSTYCHEVVKFVHTLITTEDCVADFSRMPLHLIDGTYFTSIDLKPVFQALKFLPTISGIQMKDVGRPDFFYAIADIVRDSPTIRLISLEACNVSEGIPEFAYALTQNENLHLEYLDISDNPFNDLTPLSGALASNQGDLWYLDFSNCGMSNQAVFVAMTSLITNENLWGIIHLDFRGAIVREDSVNLILTYLSLVAENNSCTLKFLSFGSITTHLAHVIHALCKYQQPIEAFYLNGSTFDEQALIELLLFVQKSTTLQELDISDTNLKPDDIYKVIIAISRNNALESVDLHLNGLHLNGSKLKRVLEAFEETKTFRWQTLTFEDNDLSPKDVDNLVSVLKKMPTLTGLSISHNLKKGQSSVNAVENILDHLTKLQKLWIAGDESRYIGKKLASIFRKASNKDLLIFDISHNHIKDEGLEELKRLVRSSTQLYELMIDGSHPHKPETLIDFMSEVAKSKTLRRMKFPADDVDYLIRRFVPKKEREQVFYNMSLKQREVQDTLLRNQTSIGFHSDLSEQLIPELDDMLEEMTLQSHDRVSMFNTLLHNGSTLAYGLPFPHLNENDDQTAHVQEYPPTAVMEEYDIPQAAVVCEEKPSDTKSMHVKAISIKKGTDILQESESRIPPAYANDLQFDKPKQESKMPSFTNDDVEDVIEI